MSDELDKLKILVYQYTMHPYNKSQNQISKLMKCSRSTIHRVQKMLMEEGKIKRDEQGKIISEQEKTTSQIYEEINKNDFGDDPFIATWIASMKRSGIETHARYVRRLWVFCETLRIRPEAILSEIMDVQKLVDMFEKIFRNGKAKYVRSDKSFLEENKENSSIKPYVEAVKSFRERNGKETPAGFLEVKVQNYDIYRWVGLDDEEREIGIKFMSQFGEVAKNTFIIHHELGVRPVTLFTMKPFFIRVEVDIDGKLCEYYKCRIYEPKQKMHYEKIIISPEAKEVVKMLKNGDMIQPEFSMKKNKEDYNKQLRKLFEHLGKFNLKDKPFKKGTLEYYYSSLPTSSIRHSAVHRLMRLTGYRKEVVQSMFWEVPETLNVYAGVSIDSLVQHGVCFVCNKPSGNTDKNKVFCSLRHAILYFNYNEITKEPTNIDKQQLNTNQEVIIS